jgi:hypothetical protein
MVFLGQPTRHNKNQKKKKKKKKKLKQIFVRLVKIGQTFTIIIHSGINIFLKPCTNYNVYIEHYF